MARKIYNVYCNICTSRVAAMMELMSTKLFETYNGSVKQSSSSLHHQLTQYQLRKREQIAQAKSQSVQTFESALYSCKENAWNVNIGESTRPLPHFCCATCCPNSRNTISSAGLRPPVDLFKVENYKPNAEKGFLSLFSTIRHCLTFKKHHYPYIYDSVLNEENVINIIQQSGQTEAEENGITDAKGISFFIEKERIRARRILDSMHSTLADIVLRIMDWVTYKAMPWSFTSMSVPKGQIDMLKKTAATGVPMIFLPLHRSHVDYIAVTFVLCNNDIRPPLVAAGENLRIPFFGWLLRCLGAFFIKRRIDPVSGKKDKVYRAVLHNYMTHCLQAGHYFEIFIEGGRTRSGKPCMPKGGLMSVFVDAYLSGILEDAYLVPVSINYDKLVDGNFISELTGEPKKPETFTAAVKSMWKALSSHYGLIRVDFNQPFSLHELVRSFQGKVMNNGGSFHITPSSSSLYGTDVVNEEQRQLVDSITRHVLYDCSQSTAVMSTNALSFLLLYCYRSGATLGQLVYALDRLRDELTNRKKDTGFTGQNKDVIENAADLLGPGLIQIDASGDEKIFKPVTVLPNVLELNYYSNTLVAHFCLEGVVGRTVLCLSVGSESPIVRLDKVIDVSVCLCEILQYEFIFTKSCQSLNDAIFDVVDRMSVHELLIQDTISQLNRTSELDQRKSGIIDDDDDEDDFVSPPQLYKVNRNEEKLLLYGRLLEPLIDVYCIVAAYLPKLVGEIVPEILLNKKLLEVVKEYIENGSIKYAESLSMETVKNCVKLLEKWKVLDCHIEDDSWMDNPDFTNYLSKLSVYNLEKLCKEPDHLEVEKNAVLNQTQELAFSNYKTFIKTAECSRELFQQFQKTEAGLDSLISRVPSFTADCENLLRRCSSLESEKQACSIALKRHSDLLQVLELPQLLESAVRTGLVEESLALIAFAQRFAKSHPNIEILQKISAETEKWSVVLRSRLLSELKGELTLPRCLVDIGVLRRMGALSEPELRLIFLQARGHHLSSLLAAANADGQSGVQKKIEIYRSQLFNIITQYKGVFPESSVMPGKQKQIPLLEEWVSNKVNEFLSGAENWTSEGSSLEGVMYLGQSLGRVGCDIRGLAIPHFLSGKLSHLRSILETSLAEFPGDMDKAALTSIQEDLCGSNIPFYPLARLTNGILSCFNYLRHGAPLALAHPLTTLVEETLATAAQQIADFHNREQQALGETELELLCKLALCFSDQMITYIQTCLHAVYPPAEIAVFLSISVYKLQSQGLTYLNTERILQPIKHLLLPQVSRPLPEESRQPPSQPPPAAVQS